MNTLQIKLMKIMYSLDQHERVAFYSHFEDETGFNRKQLQVAIKELRALGYVHWVRGLAIEDHQGYYGSGFVLTFAGTTAIRPYIPQDEI